MRKQSRGTITDARGRHSFDNVETNGLYTDTPARVNYTFSPQSRTFILLGAHTDASFTASANNGNNRDPNSGPDADFTGYNFLLNKLNTFGNFQDAEMVKAFLVSGEY